MKTMEVQANTQDFGTKLRGTPPNFNSCERNLTRTDYEPSSCWTTPLHEEARSPSPSPSALITNKNITAMPTRNAKTLPQQSPDTCTQYIPMPIETPGNMRVATCDHQHTPLHVPLEINQNQNEAAEEVTGTWKPPRNVMAYEEDDLGFDFESSDECSVQNFGDLPIVKHSSSFNSTSWDDLDGCDSTCSSSHFSNEDSDCSEEDDSDDDEHENKFRDHFQSQIDECVITTSTLSLNTVSCLDANEYAQRKRSVRFSSCLVTDVRTRPFTSDDEWHKYYYSAHELQRMIDEARDSRQECASSLGENEVIFAEEDDLDL
jgi:hypothetical protein